MITTLLLVILWSVVAILIVYTTRHYLFTFDRLFARQRQPYIDVTEADWPHVVVFVPCHNEEMVVAGSLEAILAADYPHERLTIVPIDDRSTDRTGDILEEYAARYPQLIIPFHRSGGRPGKAAALADATQHFGGEVHLVFDADYVPGPKLLKQLVAPFFDPEVGAVMGRVVPHNVGSGLITRLLDLERAGGYQVDQQARMNLGLIPQYGGTVGGVRRDALLAVGGWRTDTLAEDTDITFRLVLRGWLVVYQNRSECYEEVPESWHTRVRQIRRWAEGHNQSLVRYLGPLLRTRSGNGDGNARPHLGFFKVLDGALLLGVFAVGPVLVLGWFVAVALYYLGYGGVWGPLGIFAICAFGTVGNFAAFFEVAAATRLDGSRNRVRLLPLLFFGFLVSLTAVSSATLRQLVRGKGTLRWDKTERYRAPGGGPPLAGENGEPALGGNGANGYRRRNGNGFASRTANGGGDHA